MTDDPRHFALQAALRRMRVHLEQAVADNDAAIAAWDAIDDKRINGMPDRAATDRDAPASPIDTPQTFRPGATYIPLRVKELRCEQRDTCWRPAADWRSVCIKPLGHHGQCGWDEEVEVTHFEDTEHQFQNAETGERRSGSPISAKPGDAEASHA